MAYVTILGLRKLKNPITAVFRGHFKFNDTCTGNNFIYLHIMLLKSVDKKIVGFELFGQPKITN